MPTREKLLERKCFMYIQNLFGEDAEAPLRMGGCGWIAIYPDGKVSADLGRMDPFMYTYICTR